ncbi:MAG: fumarylacetoacetase [Pirellulaceae bacterium]|nr:fumarylacetoacetase [Pirellulaceae bacterium]
MMITSWIESANDAGLGFSLDNLPYCSFSQQDRSQRLGVVVGDRIVDLYLLADENLLPSKQALMQPVLNDVMALTKANRLALREALKGLLADQPGMLRDDSGLVEQGVHEIQNVYFHLPARIGDFSDFYASRYHATNVGAMLRPDEPLLSNYKHLPIGYHGRSSSITVSGTNIRRPVGQIAPGVGEENPRFEESSKLDYEMELGVYLAGGNLLGDPIKIDNVEDSVFGFCLLNDWSARDLQRWEYQPLGPFLSKSFASSVSPFVVTAEALEPFRVPANERSVDDPPLLPYLDSDLNRTAGGLDLQLDVFLLSEKMRSVGLEPYRISSGRFRDMYWTIAQMITHQASNGCNIRPGDLIGSGTVSGREKISRGCLLERNWLGDFGETVSSTNRLSLELPTGEKRDFLENGDEVILRGFAENSDHHQVSLGECRGRILAANV